MCRTFAKSPPPKAAQISSRSPRPEMPTISLAPTLKQIYNERASAVIHFDAAADIAESPELKANEDVGQEPPLDSSSQRGCAKAKAFGGPEPGSRRQSRQSNLRVSEVATPINLRDPEALDVAGCSAKPPQKPHKSRRPLIWRLY